MTPPTRKNLKIALLGYTGDIAREFRERLGESELLSESSITFYDYSVEEEYSLLGDYKGEGIVVRYPSLKELQEHDLLILLAASAKNRDLAKHFTGRVLDCADSLDVYDCLYSSRDEEPLASARVIKVPHPAAAVASLLLGVLIERIDPEWIHLQILLPASIKDKGVESLASQIMDHLNLAEVSPEPFGGTLAFNLLSPEEEERERIEREVTATAQGRFSLECFYTGIFHGIHLQGTFRGGPKGLKKGWPSLFEGFSDLEMTVESALSPRDAVGSSRVRVSRLREYAGGDGKTIRSFSAAADNYLSGVIAPAFAILRKMGV